ncbi:T9SS type A sorting domain-containing protein [Hymenobacter sediminicola]|uniref:T9SS type A sorting domain-containing protein n=1 Tax=Hymenobacter sediminicola TaxID=2761579 RepID=A0A7G7W6Z5_9BACT|nr:T9SS type A sorting domain-containing protein [Hymenobacter sediminicola]QNH62138.1 T9SS type A sorting domain-containing protein [Hymenobacter sediminicola]
MRFVASILLLLTLLLPARAQRLVQERVYPNPTNPSAGIGFNDLRLMPGGDLAASGPASDPASGFRNHLWRIRAATLDTVWHRVGVGMFSGDQRLHVLADGSLTFCGNYLPPTYRRETVVQRFSAAGQLRTMVPTVNPFGTDRIFGASLLAPGNGYFIALTSFPATRLRGQLIRTDSSGNLHWIRNQGWQYNDYWIDMQYTRSGNLLLAGISQVPNTPRFVLKLLEVNLQGDSVQGRLIAPLGTNYNVEMHLVYNRLLPTADGGYLLPGRVDTVDAQGRSVPMPILVKVNAQLQPQWTYVHRALWPQSGLYGNMVALQDGSVLVQAYYYNPRTLSDRLRLHRFSATGQLLSTMELPSVVCPSVRPAPMVPDATGRYLYIGGSCSDYISGNRSGAYLAVVDLQSLPGAVVLSVPQPAQPTAAAPLTFALFPNPATTTATVRYQLPAGTTAAALHLTDATGRLVRRLTLRGGSGGEVAVPLAGLAPGLYGATLLAADGRPLATRRLAVATE